MTGIDGKLSQIGCDVVEETLIEGIYIEKCLAGPSDFVIFNCK